MVTHQGTMQVMAPETQMIGWETPNPYRGKVPSHGRKGAAIKERWNSISVIMSRRLNRVMPPQRKYCGCSRRLSLIFCTVVFVVILALAIGLGVGLTRGSEYVLLRVFLIPNAKTSQAAKTFLSHQTPKPSKAT